MSSVKHPVDIEKAIDAWADWCNDYTPAEEDTISYRVAREYLYDLIEEVREQRAWVENLETTLNEDRKYMAEQDARFDREAAKHAREVDRLAKERDYWLSQSSRLSGEVVAAEDKVTAAEALITDQDAWIGNAKTYMDQHGLIEQRQAREIDRLQGEMTEIWQRLRAYEVSDLVPQCDVDNSVEKGSAWMKRALTAEKALADKTAECKKLQSVAQKRYIELQEWRRLSDAVRVVHNRIEEKK